MAELSDSSVIFWAVSSTIFKVVVDVGLIFNVDAIEELTDVGNETINDGGSVNSKAGWELEMKNLLFSPSGEADKLEVCSGMMI